MRAIIISIFSISAILFFTFSRNPHVEVFKLDKENSKVEWSGKAKNADQIGTVGILAGELRNNHGKMYGHVVLDISAIALTNEKGKNKTTTEEKLKSKDVFNTTLHPTITFTINSITPAEVNAEGHTHTVKGQLKAKGQTNDVSFNATIESKDNNLILRGEQTVNASNLNDSAKQIYPAMYESFTINFNLAFQTAGEE